MTEAGLDQIRRRRESFFRMDAFEKKDADLVGRERQAAGNPFQADPGDHPAGVGGKPVGGSSIRAEKKGPGGEPVKDWKRLGIFVVIVAAVVVIDHAGKLIAAACLADGVRHAYLADFLRLEAVHNTGVILSLGSQLPEAVREWMLPAVTAAVLVWVSVLLIREKDCRLASAGLSLVWAGGFSNLVDRLAYGKVFDFFNLGFGAVRTGTSNLADVAILAGIPLIAIGWWRTKQEQEPESVETGLDT
jgi:signal peptidase II